MNVVLQVRDFYYKDQIMYMRIHIFLCILSNGNKNVPVDLSKDRFCVGDCVGQTAFFKIGQWYDMKNYPRLNKIVHRI